MSNIAKQKLYIFQIHFHQKLQHNSKLPFENLHQFSGICSWTSMDFFLLGALRTFFCEKIFEFCGGGGIKMLRGEIFLEILPQDFSVFHRYFSARQGDF